MWPPPKWFEPKNESAPKPDTDFGKKLLPPNDPNEPKKSSNSPSSSFKSLKRSGKQESWRQIRKLESSLKFSKFKSIYSLNSFHSPSRLMWWKCCWWCSFEWRLSRCCWCPEKCESKMLSKSWKKPCMSKLNGLPPNAESLSPRSYLARFSLSVEWERSWLDSLIEL